jgi:hypothetical protein
LEMSTAARNPAEYYRQKAEEIRALAGRARTVVRVELFEIAELFERMADRVEKRESGHHEFGHEPAGIGSPRNL